MQTALPPVLAILLLSLIYYASGRARPRKGNQKKQLTPAEEDYRKTLDDCEATATSEFDKTAVTLSAGALGVSLAFLRDVAPQPVAWTVTSLLAPGWLCLIISLLGVLWSHLTSMKSMRHESECLLGLKEKPDGEPAGGPWRARTEASNYVAITGCVLGIALLFAFVTFNIWSRSHAQESAAATTSATQTPAISAGRSASWRKGDPGGARDTGSSHTAEQKVRPK